MRYGWSKVARWAVTGLHRAVRGAVPPPHLPGVLESHRAVGYPRDLALLDKSQLSWTAVERCLWVGPEQPALKAAPFVISIWVTEAGTQLAISVDPAKGYKLLVDASEEFGLTSVGFFIL